MPRVPRGLAARRPTPDPTPHTPPRVTQGKGREGASLTITTSITGRNPLDRFNDENPNDFRIESLERFPFDYDIVFNSMYSLSMSIAIDVPFDVDVDRLRTTTISISIYLTTKSISIDVTTRTLVTRRPVGGLVL